jgi:hypothetical protein
MYGIHIANMYLGAVIAYFLTLIFFGRQGISYTITAYYF